MDQEETVSSVEQVTHDISVPTVPRKNKLPILLLISGIIVIGLLVVGIMSGRLAIALSSNARAVVLPAVCTADDIAIFNTRSVGADNKFKQLSENITGRRGHENDVNCAFMLYIHFFDERMYSKAIDQARRVQELVDQGNFIDNRIEEVQSIKLIQSRIEDVKSLPDGSAQDGWVE